MAPSHKLPVAILGATGAVGQRFIALLANHPWFEIAVLTGSERSIGRRYGDVVHWVLDTAPPPAVADLVVQPTEVVAEVPVAFSALPTEHAREAETRWAVGGVAVCTNASPFRMHEQVPLLVPEVNAEHIHLVEQQRSKLGWRGCIVANANCATTTLVMPLKPLHSAFGVEKVIVTTLQAISGAGYPGVAALDILDNVIPNIANGGEEHKLETESCKILGSYSGEGINFAPIALSANVTRVPVIDGHTAVVSVGLKQHASVEEAAAVLREFRGSAVVQGLPTAPPEPLTLRMEQDRPQPRRDRDLYGGMGTTVGRLRPCPLFDLKFVVLSHNTIRGAAGGAILNAELLVAEGIVA